MVRSMNRTILCDLCLMYKICNERIETFENKNNYNYCFYNTYI